MPRFSFRLWLLPDAAGIETYVYGHLNPFPELYHLIRLAGIRGYTIWLDGCDLFLTREADEIGMGETLDMTNPVHRQWADTMGPLFDKENGHEIAGHPSEVFRLNSEANPGCAQMTYRGGLVFGLASMEAVAKIYGQMPVGVGTALREAGVQRQWAWVEDGSLWTYLECDDLAETESLLMASGPYQAWLRSMSSFFDARTRREGWRRTREVFRCD